MRTSLVIAVCALTASLTAQEAFVPAQDQTGSVPQLPALAVGGGDVQLELTVGSDGQVSDVRPLRMTAPFTEFLTQAVRDWHFRAAEDRTSGRGATGAVASKVLVVGLFRPPALNLPTLGEAPNEGAAASAETALPLTTTLPAFPPQANRSGVVLLEARVDRAGAVSDVKVLRSSPPFDEPARRAVSEWTFRPATIHNADAATLVYVVLGFAAPVSNGLPAGTLQ